MILGDTFPERSFQIRSYGCTYQADAPAVCQSMEGLVIPIALVDPDGDGDSDGVLDDDDNCPEVANPNQTNTDGDTKGDACDADDDNDSVADAGDNCPLDANADQADGDGDGVGDACDGDLDGDGVPDVADVCLPSEAGEMVDATGCSIADLCPCDGDWKNHGKYVSCVSKAAGDFAKAGLIGRSEKGAITSEAAKSSCGKDNDKAKKGKK